MIIPAYNPTRQGGTLRNQSRWMAISGSTAFFFFLIANFTTVFAGSAVIAGCLQLTAATFVFFVWSNAFRQSSGFKKVVAFIGAAVPVVMGCITVYRVIIPW